jgi:hypothetical protein
MQNLVAYQKSIDLLKKAITPFGFVASVEDITNYRRVWTRDAVIHSIAALRSGETDLIACSKNTIITIFEHQHPLGFMPSNVQPDNGKSSYGGTVGRVDNVCWAVIGLCKYAIETGDEELLERYKTQITKCFEVMEIWEYNGKGLMYVPQSGDWADEYIQHGYILYDQLLRLWALEMASKLYHFAPYQAKADEIRKLLSINFRSNPTAPDLYAPNLRHQMVEAPKSYWLLGFNPARIYHQFDLQANALALLLRIGTPAENRSTLSYIKDWVAVQKHILPSFYPSIETSDWEMEELKNNYAYTFRNHPHQFHNGGLWPVWNGWMVAALHQHGETTTAALLTQYIHEANAKGNDAFNECLHGQTLEPSGVNYCVWSAAGAVLAELGVNM